jgi:hypothetical protein
LADDAGLCFYLHAAARKGCDGFLDIVHIKKTRDSGSFAPNSKVIPPQSKPK